jgi:environmental stress-induced protein Ves
MTWNLIRLADAPAAPWRNGGGVTRELATFPTREDWAWRISVADVSADGPFSHFPGVQRWFAVVQGNGVRLAINEEAHEVKDTSPPLEFDGAARVDSWLLARPTQDLNLMVQRHRACGVMTRLASPRRFTTKAEGAFAVFSLDGPTSIRLRPGNDVTDLPPHSLAWAQLARGTELEVATAGALCMEITPRL